MRRRPAPVLITAAFLCLATAGTQALGAQREGDGPGSTQGPAPLADADLAFTRGVLAFHDGDYQAAKDRFEEALRLAPGNQDARRWLGLTRRNLDRPAGEAPAPAPTWVGDFAVLPEVPRFEGRVYLGLGSDSNPNLMPEDLILPTPEGDPVAGAEADGFALADVRLAFQSADGAPELPGAGRAWGLVLRGTQAVHDEFGYLDLGRLEAVAHFAWGADPLGYLAGPFGYARVPLGRSRAALLVQAGASKDWLDGEGLADRLLAGGSLALNQGERGQTRLSLSYRDTDFEDEAPGAGALARSGDELRGELAQYLFLGRRNRYLQVAFSASERDAGAAFDASSVLGGAELSLPLAPRWTLYLTGAHRRDDYDEPASNLFDPGGEPREDRELRLGGSLLWRLTDRLFASGRATWIDHEIETPGGFAAPDLSYERTLATVGITWIF